MPGFSECLAADIDESDQLEDCAFETELNESGRHLKLLLERQMKFVVHDI